MLSYQYWQPELSSIADCKPMKIIFTRELFIISFQVDNEDVQRTLSTHGSIVLRSCFAAISFEDSCEYIEIASPK